MLKRFYYITVRFLRHVFQFDTFDVEVLEVADNLKQILGIRKKQGRLSLYVSKFQSVMSPRSVTSTWLHHRKTTLALPPSKFRHCSVVKVQSKLSKVSSGSFRLATPESETFVLLRFNLHNNIKPFSFPVDKPSSVTLVPERLSSSSLTRSIK